MSYFTKSQKKVMRNVFNIKKLIYVALFFSPLFTYKTGISFLNEDKKNSTGQQNSRTRREFFTKKINHAFLLKWSESELVPLSSSWVQWGRSFWMGNWSSEVRIWMTRKFVDNFPCCARQHNSRANSYRKIFIHDHKIPDKYITLFLDSMKLWINNSPSSWMKVSVKDAFCRILRLQLILKDSSIFQPNRGVVWYVQLFQLHQFSDLFLMQDFFFVCVWKSLMISVYFTAVSKWATNDFLKFIALFLWCISV